MKTFPYNRVAKEVPKFSLTIDTSLSGNWLFSLVSAIACISRYQRKKYLAAVPNIA